MSKDMTKNKIASLQGVRAIAFMCVFLSHVAGIKSGGLGVSIFLVLSGFVLKINHSNYISELSVKTCYTEAIKRIKRLYILHLLMFIWALPDCWHRLSWTNFIKVSISVLKIISNIFLFQSWIPKSEFYFSFNAVSWYLSVMIFLYFVFPYLNKSVMNCSYKIIIQRISLIIILQITIAGILFFLRGLFVNIPMEISDDLPKWITYILPIYRMTEFYEGILLGAVYENKKNHNVCEKIIFLQILSIILIPVSAYLGEYYFSSIYCIKYSLIYIPCSILLIYSMSNNVCISRIISAKLFIIIGELSGIAFLLHQRIISVVVELNLFNKYQIIYNTITSFAVTMVLSYFYIELEKMIIGHKVKNENKK